MADHPIIELARRRVLVLDGAMGTTVQARDLPLSDYLGLENCTEAIVLTRPDVVLDIHKAFLAVGCDGVLTNTFGANKIVLGEFGLTDRVREVNRKAAELARQACAVFSRPGRPRFVIGSVGPGTRLPSLGQTTWDVLVDSYTEQVRGLLDGGVDAVLIETCQDILQAKSAIVAATDAMHEHGRQVPLFCTVTVETTGTLLLGTEMAAALTALTAYDQVAAFGLNCATGPQEMSEHVRYLSHHCDRLLLVQPNAGLPQLVYGKPHYALTPAELARWLLEFVEVDGVNIVGGCCGTTPAHLAAVVDAIGDRPPKPRRPAPEPAVCSLYQQATLRQENAVLAIGERTNANGSKKFRELLAAGDVDGMVQMARDQVKHGSHCLDVCTAYVGRDEAADMTAVLRRFVTDVTAPLCIDSTEINVIESALKLYGGKAIINSINLEDGEHKLDAICRLAKRHGAALIALTIDESGMAKTAGRKVEVARRIYDLVTQRHGIAPTDLIFDPLTFTICTGNEDDRRLGLETLDALRRIKEECPGVHTLLGLSNISFGVKPACRQVINSVFLHYARDAGLDAAILHASGIVPLFKIEETQRKLAEDLIFDRRRDGYDPLAELLTLFAEHQAAEQAESAAPRTVEERLKRRIIDGNRTALEDDLEEALLTSRPLDIINDVLLDGMKTVGDLFGAGQMQLPFVLQSAETMKAAVTYLEPFMDRAEDRGKGTIVLATVQGDVHDIGKNLVDIILTNNGYTVVNLGIKQPISNIVDAYARHRADAIGLSGLLVKSTVVMKDNLLVLNERGLSPPVILGGAALTRKYVEQDLRPQYRGRLFYAKDAFAGLHTMEAIVAGTAGAEVAGYATAHEAWPAASAVGQPMPHEATRPAQKLLVAAHEGGGDSTPRGIYEISDAASESLAEPSALRHGYVPPRSDIARTEPVPPPPFWGARVIERIDPRAALAYLNENMLFHVQWQYRKQRRSAEEFERFINAEVRPVLRRLLEQCEAEDILQLKAIYGFWPAQSDGDTLYVYDPADHEKVLAEFEFPRMRKPPYWCLSDFFRPVGGARADRLSGRGSGDDVAVTPRRGGGVGSAARASRGAGSARGGEMDVAGFMVVTAGGRVSEVERAWFAGNRYQDYLHLHGLGVEITEALAEYIHKQMRAEWGIAGADARDKQDIFKQRYQGSRYSFGYPACPRLEDQLKLWPLLEPGRIGVTLTEEFQLEPEQTTTALVVHHRQAKYFNVR